MRRSDCSPHTALFGGYAEPFHVLFRLAQRRWSGRLRTARGGSAQILGGLRRVGEITVIEPQDNACSEARISTRIRRRPGASSRLFGRYHSLEDISNALPPSRRKSSVWRWMQVLRSAYPALRARPGGGFAESPGNQSVISSGLNALLLYPHRCSGSET